MKCFKCSGKGSLKFNNNISCRSCFCEIIEKKVRKEIRLNNLLSKNDNVLLLDDGTEKSTITLFLMERLVKDPTIKIKIKKIKKYDINKDYDIKKEFNKIIPAWSLDDEIESYLQSIFRNSKIKVMHTHKIIKPLIGVTKEELILFAKINKIKFNKSEPLDDDLQEMLERLEKRYPGTKFGILRNIRKTR